MIYSNDIARRVGSAGRPEQVAQVLPSLEGQQEIMMGFGCLDALPRDEGANLKAWLSHDKANLFAVDAVFVGLDDFRGYATLARGLETLAGQRDEADMTGIVKGIFDSMNGPKNGESLIPEIREEFIGNTLKQVAMTTAHPHLVTAVMEGAGGGFDLFGPRRPFAEQAEFVVQGNANIAARDGIRAALHPRPAAPSATGGGAVSPSTRKLLMRMP